MPSRKPKEPELSTCIWSDDPEKRYRYVLRHSWRSPDLPSYVPSKCAVWIGLNPSTAFEGSLDPTLRRVRSFSQSWGCDCFAMLNLFGYRATLPTDMMVQTDPVGPDNDHHIMDTVNAAGTTHVIAAWGCDGGFRGRDREVMQMLAGRLSCLGLTKQGFCRHPLYVKGGTPLQPFGFPHPLQPIVDCA